MQTDKMWIQPLEMKTWIVNIFSGNPDIFLGIAIIAIAGLSAYFKMSILNMLFMMGLFLLMLSKYIQSPFIALFSILAGLLVGIVINKFANRT